MFGLDFGNINLRLFIRTRRLLSLAILVIALSIFLLVLVLYPQVQRIFELNKKIKTERQLITKLRDKSQALRQIESNEVYIKKDKISTVLPSNKAVLELLSSLSMIAEDNSVILNEISLSPGLIATDSAEPVKAARGRATANKNTSGAESIVIKFKASGTKNSLQKFMSLINNITPISGIKQLQMTSVAGDNVIGVGTDAFQAEIELLTYYFQKEIKATIESPLPDVGQLENETLSSLNNYLEVQYKRPINISGGGLENLFNEDELKILEN